MNVDGKWTDISTDREIEYEQEGGHEDYYILNYLN
jgi:hypothetical protein